MSKTIKIINRFLFPSFIFSACLLQNASALDVKITAKSDDTSKPKIFGKTNLPNGTQLLVSVERPSNGYGGDSKTLVINGEFEAGPYGMANGNLPPGTYSVIVTMTDPALQLQHVKDVVGKRGEKLSGNLISRYATGNIGAIYKTTIKIAGTADKAKEKIMKDGYKSEMQNNFCTSGCMLKSGESAIAYNACIRACMK